MKITKQFLENKKSSIGWKMREKRDERILGCEILLKEAFCLFFLSFFFFFLMMNMVGRVGMMNKVGRRWDSSLNSEEEDNLVKQSVQICSSTGNLDFSQKCNRNTNRQLQSLQTTAHIIRGMLLCNQNKTQVNFIASLYLWMKFLSY